MARILIIDDEELVCRVLMSKVNSMGHEAECALTLKDGMAKATAGSFDVVLLDVGLPDGNGLEVVSTIRAQSSSPEVIIITGAGNPDGAEAAINSGAWDYIEKDSSVSMVALPLVRALQYREAVKLKDPIPALREPSIAGRSARMKGIMVQLAQAAVSDANLLIYGETGTGKELLAWAVHKNSHRAGGNFVVVDCAALSVTLVESILFGYEKGTYTGADRAREGLIKQANGGTLFLDEVGELPLSIQKSFLRVLQEKHFRPLGGAREEKSDFRLIAATNRILEEMALQGQFRSDLLFRLRAFQIEMPPLRENVEDIPELVRHHLEKMCKRYGLPIKKPTPGFLEALMKYDWPGNVRELVNTLEWTLTVARNDTSLFSNHLPNHIRVKITRAGIKKNTPGVESARPGQKGLPPLRDARESAVGNMERQYLLDLMAVTRENIKESCLMSGLSKSRLYELMKKYGITNDG